MALSMASLTPSILCNCARCRSSWPASITRNHRTSRVPICGWRQVVASCAASATRTAAARTGAASCRRKRRVRIDRGFERDQVVLFEGLDDVICGRERQAHARLNHQLGLRQVNQNLPRRPLARRVWPLELLGRPAIPPTGRYRSGVSRSDATASRSPRSAAYGFGAIIVQSGDHDLVPSRLRDHEGQFHCRFPRTSSAGLSPAATSP